MNIGQFIAHQQARLDHLPRASRLLRQLVATRLNVAETHVWAHPDRPLPPAVLQRLVQDCDALADGQPLAYVFGETPFLSWTFATDARALAPRPETEALAEYVITRCQATPPRTIIDLCTGSGVLGLALALAFPQAQVLLTDISPMALALAAENTARHQLQDRVSLHRGNLWDAVPANHTFDLIVANPPYVACDDPVETTVTCHEPQLALYSGANGLDHLHRILQRLPQFANPGATVGFEMGHRHHQQLQEPQHLVNGHWHWVNDPFDVPRYLIGRMPRTNSPQPTGKETSHG